jgi:hypothetical protein
LIVAIIKPGVGPANAAGAPTDVTMPAFSFSPNEALAEMIVQAWTIQAFQDQLLDRDTSVTPPKVTDAAVKAATDAVNAAGFNLKRAVVITEKEHDNNYKMQQPETEVVFVLPNPKRLGTSFVPGESLLDTARMLMACTPNGI